MTQIPAYEELKRLAEEKLSKSLNGDSNVKLIKGYDKETLKIICEIDHEKFRNLNNWNVKIEM